MEGGFPWPSGFRTLRERYSELEAEHLESSNMAVEILQLWSLKL